MARNYRPLSAEQKRFIHRNYGQMTAAELAAELGVEAKRVKNYIDNRRKLLEPWTRKTTEQKSLNCWRAGRLGAQAKWGS